MSMVTWDCPGATQCVLLIHSGGGCGAVWHKVARGLVQAGYAVDAPDLAGHGFAPPLRAYSVKSLAQDLGSRLTKHYDIAVGASFGGPILLDILAQKQLRPRRIVLCDPVLDADLKAYTPERIEAMATAALTLASEETMLASNPGWEPEDAMIKRLAAVRLDPDAIRGLFADAEAGRCGHDLLTPAVRNDCDVEIIAADLACGGIYGNRHKGLLEERFPTVRLTQPAGTRHDLHREDYNVVIDIIVEQSGI